MQSISKLKHNDIKEVSFWVPPCPASLMLTITMNSLEEIQIDILILDDIGEYMLPDYLIPRRIYINKQLIDLKSKEETLVISLLSYLINQNLLGHKEGLEMITAKKMIDYFTSN